MSAFTFVEITSNANYLSGMFARYLLYIALSASPLCASLYTSTAGISEKLTPQVTRVLHESVVYMAHGVPGFKSRVPHYGRFSAKVLFDRHYNIQLRRPTYITGRTVEGQRFATVHRIVANNRDLFRRISVQESRVCCLWNYVDTRG